jgi:hypothetical protein
LLNWKLFYTFVIPIVLIGLLILFVATLDVESSDVRVAGALIGPEEFEMYVNDCYFAEIESTRQLFIEMEGRNFSASEVNLNPGKFQLVLSKSNNPAGTLTMVYNPMRYTSICEDAPASESMIPPDSVRSVTLVFYGETLPSGDEWDDYLLSLEYYDPSASLMMSKLINPSEE